MRHPDSSQFHASFLKDCRGLLENFMQFLFSADRGLSLAYMRIVLGTTLLYLAIFRTGNLDQYGPGSLIPRDQALVIFPEFYKPWLQFFFWPDSLAPVAHYSLIGLYILLILGLSNRFFMLLTWVIAQGFIQRNYSILFGADLIGNLILFYLSFTLCNEHLSVWSWLQKKASGHMSSRLQQRTSLSQFSRDLSSIAVRLMQVQMCVIYAYTGFEKLKGMSWWDGTALWTVLANPQFTNYDLLWLSHFPIVFAIGTFITIIFEVYFPVMVYLKQTRFLWLGLGVFFHLMIGVLLGLMPFSLVMLSTYVLFFDFNKTKTQKS